jgi:hypothetical protein
MAMTMTPNTAVQQPHPTGEGYASIHDYNNAVLAWLRISLGENCDSELKRAFAEEIVELVRDAQLLAREQRPRPKGMN